MRISVTSFSYKRGVPEANAVFDVRFLKNPFYQPALSAGSGLDAAVGAYIETDPAFAPLFSQLTALPDGREYLAIAIGCTGGRHRSVHVAQKLGDFLRARGYDVTVRHRDLEQHP